MRKKESESKKVSSSLLDRRSFMRTLQAPAALAVASSLAGQQIAHADTESSARKGILDKAPVVMVWRRVSSLDNTKAFVEKVLRFPRVGLDPTSVMYDAGGALVGYAIQEVQPSNDPLYAMCSEVGLQDFAMQNNPASSLVLAPLDFKGASKNLFAERNSATSPLRTQNGETLSFLDEDGNYTCFQRPSQTALNGEAGAKLHSILRNRWAHQREIMTVADEQGAGAKKIENPMVGINLMVADVAASSKFYGEVLGLRQLASGPNEAKFDVGNLILTLTLEPSNSLVSFLRRSGRLLGDWVVFWTPEIEARFKELKACGIKFPAGVESSPIGDTAYFNDPDGYSLVLWKPSGFTKMIDFNPALNRILKEAGHDMKKTVAI